MLKINRNKILGFFGVLIAIFILVVLLYKPVIFQEGNPWPQIKGIMQLKFGDADIVKLSGSDNKFMTESKNGTTIHDFMKTKGYEFTEQMGSGYFFKSATGQTAVATHRYYSRHYSLWNITENINNTESNNDLWTTITTSDGITFQYPKEILSEYISEAQWPPKLIIEDRPFICNPSGNEIQQGGQTEQRLVDNRVYCITKESEGVAGSIYTAYTYEFPKDNQTGVITFTLRFVQCQNYDEPKASECESERSAFDIDGTVDRIVQSIKIKSKQLSIAEELKDCLPKSDMDSYERCNELLETIRNFDDCVKAGFSIMKSNPPQCATVDGRTFTDETNSTWDVALTALNSCEVESVFQTHSKLVTLNLKNGNELTAYEPQIDDVMEVVDGLKGGCSDVRMATE
ncbi:MAG: hypothetical protein PHE20_04220 [Patescibacteria group bacterium]|nr:hypothetical protein [Patescibacteria group bacterium]